MEIRNYSVIYAALDDLRAAMQGMLAPEEVEETIGTVEVRQTFRASQDRHDRRLLRHRRRRRAAAPRSASCATARSSTTRRSTRCERFNDDVREVAAGFECGIVLDNFQDVKEGDVLEVYETRQVERELQPS